MSIPVVVAENGFGIAVRPVEENAPAMVVAENGFGIPIVISDLGQPFVVEGLTPQIITGTGPTLAAMTEGDTIGSAVVWGSYASSAGTISVTREMDLGAGWVAYVAGATPLATTSVQVRERVTDSVATPERVFVSGVQVVAVLPVAPSLTGGAITQSGADLIITPPTASGSPTPTVTLVSVFRGATDITGSLVGLTIPAFETGAYTVNFSATNGVLPNATRALTGSFTAAAPVLNRDVRVLFIGDSTTAGVGADPTGVTDVNGSRPYSPPLKAVDWLVANGVPSHAESVAGDNLVGLAIWPSYRPDMSYAGAPATSTRSPTAGGLLVRLSSTASITFSPSIAVDSVRFAFPRYPATGTLQLNVDGVFHSSYVEAQATEDYNFVTVTGLTLATHTFTFSALSGTVHGPGFVQAWDSTKKAVQIINAGARNTTTANWSVATYPASPKNAIALIDPDITVIDLGINDYRQAGTTIAACTANIQGLIDAVAAVGSNIILVVPNPISTYNTATDTWSQAAVLTMYQSLATANPSATLIDTPAVYAAAGLGASNPATHASLSAVGLMYDPFHPKAAVYAAEGAALGAAIKNICTNNGWIA